MTDLQRLLSSLQCASPDFPTCLVWTRQRDYKDGHGLIPWRKGTRAAHVVAYQLVRGPIPEGHHLVPVCPIPACYNPWHWYAVVPSSGKLVRTRGFHEAQKTRCPEGHPYDLDNTILENYGRVCRICRTAQKAAQRAAKQ